MSRTKMQKDTVPEDFTMALALADILPVLFFALSAIVISIYFHSILFLTGALLCLWAGSAKVIWKIIVVRKKRNIWWLFLQMRIAMPIGLFLMLLSAFLHRSMLSLVGIIAGICSFPSVVFFAAGFAGMILMLIFAFTLDGSKSKNNWIEQLTNGIAQAFFFAGLIFALF